MKMRVVYVHNFVQRPSIFQRSHRLNFKNARDIWTISVN